MSLSLDRESTDVDRKDACVSVVIVQDVSVVAVEGGESVNSVMVGGVAGASLGTVEGVQGYLAHKRLPPPRTKQQDHA